MSGSRGAAMKLYSDFSCPFSHRTSIVIQEKNIHVDIEYIIDGQWPEDLVVANPYGTSPALVDRDLVLFTSSIIIDYLDELFPHPPLMPVNSVSRAKVRQMLHRVDKYWYSLWSALLNGKSTKYRKIIQEDLTVLAPVFDKYEFFMGDNFSLLNCSLAPLLLYFPSFDIVLPPSAKSVNDCAQRIFSRESFQASLNTTRMEKLILT